jgi:hypothetical protein
MRPCYALCIMEQVPSTSYTTMVGPHMVGCLHLGGNRFYRRLFQSGFPHLWLTRQVCSPSCIHRLQGNSTTPKLEPADGHLSHCEKAWQTTPKLEPADGHLSAVKKLDKVPETGHQNCLLIVTYHFWFLLKWNSGHLLVPVVHLPVPGSTWNVKQRWETL